MKRTSARMFIACIKVSVNAKHERVGCIPFDLDESQELSCAG
jgi:hypothetical protein